MEDLFSFCLPDPLPSEASGILRRRLGMRSHQKIPGFQAIAKLEWGLQAIIRQEKDGPEIVVQADKAFNQERVRYWRALVAQVCQELGSEDPQIKEAIKRQAPRQEGPVRPPGRAANKRGILGRLLRR